jgi:Zn-dependent peptidase ImmA (M78 family)/DNA-binding transcriptional regulator YiaG
MAGKTEDGGETIKGTRVARSSAIQRGDDESGRRMARRVEALIKPALLRWARDEAGFSIAEAARKADVRAEALSQWENAEARPSIPQLRRLANVYKRPIAVFYLPEVPPPTERVKDFRRAPGEVPEAMSPALRLEMRKALRRRELALEILDDLGERSASLQAVVSLNDPPEEVGEQVRQLLRSSLVEQTRRRDDYEAFNAWRTALERLGVLVFQTTGVALSEMLGFSMSKDPLPVIVINNKHHPRGRSFTLMHEFVHLLLREGGVCDLGEDANRAPESRKVEVFCNYAAGAALLPLERLHQLVGSRTPDEELISDLATHLHLGREMVARRMLIGGIITATDYQRMRLAFQKDFDTTRGQEDDGFPTPPIKAVSIAGRLFTRLVIENYDEDNLTANDVTDYLGIRLKHLPRIRESLRKAREAEERS